MMADGRIGDSTVQIRLQGEMLQGRRKLLIGEQNN